MNLLILKMPAKDAKSGITFFKEALLNEASGGDRGWKILPKTLEEKKPTYILLLIEGKVIAVYENVSDYTFNPINRRVHFNHLKEVKDSEFIDQDLRHYKASNPATMITYDQYTEFIGMNSETFLEYDLKLDESEKQTSMLDRFRKFIKLSAV